MTDARERLEAARRIIERAACNDQYRGGSREAVLDAVEALCAEGVQEGFTWEVSSCGPLDCREIARRLVRGKDEGRKGGCGTCAGEIDW